MRVLAARATELERDFPFALVRQLFDRSSRRSACSGARGAARRRDRSGARRARPDRNAQNAPARRHTDAFAVLHGLDWPTATLAEQQPLLLAVDDAHWSDAASLDFLGFLLPRLEELPLLLVLACRPDEAGAEGSLARIATDSLAQRLTPGALSPQGAAALLADALEHEPEQAFAATCHEVSGGNPFLLCELARTVAAEQIDPAAAQAPRVRELAPERVTRTVLVRLARLSPEAQSVARAVVVLGEEGDTRLAAELAGLDESLVARAADELRAAAILDPDATLRFVHPLVRTAFDAELPAGERAAATRARWSCCAHAARAPSSSPPTWSRPRRAATARPSRRCWRRAARRSRAALRAPRSPTSPRAARAGAGRPACRDPRLARHGRHPRARPAAVRGVLPEVLDGAGARTACAPAGRQGEHLDDLQRSRRRRRRCWSTRSRSPTERGDVEGAFAWRRSGACSCGSPLTELRARLARTATASSPDSVERAPRGGLRRGVARVRRHRGRGDRGGAARARPRRPHLRRAAGVLRAGPAAARADPRGRAGRGPAQRRAGARDRARARRDARDRRRLVDERRGRVGARRPRRRRGGHPAGARRRPPRQAAARRAAAAGGARRRARLARGARRRRGRDRGERRQRRDPGRRLARRSRCSRAGCCASRRDASTGRRGPAGAGAARDPLGGVRDARAAGEHLRGARRRRARGA